MSLWFSSRAARVVALALLLALPWSAHADTPPSSPAVPTGDGHFMYGGKYLGSIGIGTDRPATVLDAPIGEIRPGSSGASCTAQIGGAIRYADAKLQVCDGANWRVLVMEPAR
jgi:hypothetical protein